MQYNTSEHCLSHHQLPVNVDIDVEFTHENPAFLHQDPTMKPWGKLPWFFHISWPQLPSVSLSWAQWIGPPGHTCHGHGRSCVPFETSLYQSVDSIMSYVHFMSISCLPSGKLSHNYGTSPLFMGASPFFNGKNQLFLWPFFNSYVWHHQRVIKLTQWTQGTRPWLGSTCTKTWQQWTLSLPWQHPHGSLASLCASENQPLLWSIQGYPLVI